MNDLKKTPLYDRHAAAGAKIAPFAGFAMPIQYGSILAEHSHTRTQASLFDICHMGEFTVSNPGAADALKRAVTQNLDTLAAGKCRYGFLLNQNGGVIDDLIVYCLEKDRYMLVVNGARVNEDFRALGERLPEEVLLEDISDNTAKIDLQGPASFDVLQSLLPGEWADLKYFNFKWVQFQGVPLMVSRTGYTGELGYEFFLPAYKAGELWDLLLTDERVAPAGLGARDTIRLEMGYPLYGQDLDEEHSPAEGGYGALLTNPADYVGKAGAGRIRRRLVGLLLEGRRSARHGDTVLAGGREVGVVTSGSFCPSLGRAAALAYVDAAAAEGEAFAVRTAKAELAATPAELPFYKDGTARKKPA